MGLQAYRPPVPFLLALSQNKICSVAKCGGRARLPQDHARGLPVSRSLSLTLSPSLSLPFPLSDSVWELGLRVLEAIVTDSGSKGILD